MGLSSGISWKMTGVVEKMLKTLGEVQLTEILWKFAAKSDVGVAGMI